MFEPILLFLIASAFVFSLVLALAPHGYVGNIENPFARAVAAILMIPAAIILVVFLSFAEALVTRSTQPLYQLVDDLRHFPGILTDALRGN